MHLGLPFDVQKAQVNADDIWADERFSNYPALPQSPNLNNVLEVLAALKTAKTPVIVCGGGVILAGGTAALAVFTEKLDIPVCTTVSGQGSLAETHPNCAGVVGSNGGQPAIRSLVDEADLIFYIGCRAGSVTTERWRSPKAGTTVVHMDNDPAVIGACYLTKAAMVCDARLGLEALILELGAVFGKNGTVRVLAAKTEKWKAFAPLAVSNKMPIKPERVLADLAKHLPDDAVVCADPGTPCPYFSAWFEWRKPGRYFITNRAHGALGFAIGASIGAQIGRPNAKVICATGDGSFGMSVGELETMKRLNLPITILVFSNSVFGWIKAGQKSGFGARYFSVDFSRTDHAAVAAAYGIKSFTASVPSDLAAIFKKAVHFDGPTLVDIICEPLQDTAAPVSEWVA